MKIRGERECTDCGTRWSYYETGSVGCPACGSLRSVGHGERARHTDLPATFDLSAVRAELDEASSEDLAAMAAETARDYVRRRGFVSGGRLHDLDETVLAAAELRHVADVVERSRRLTEDEELYFLALLRDADDGDRPPADAIPRSFHAARGLATAEAVREYRADVRTWAADRDLTPADRSALERLGDHVTRIRLLDGDVEPGASETLIAATRDLADALRDRDETALVRAQDRLDRLE